MEILVVNRNVRLTLALSINSPLYFWFYISLMSTVSLLYSVSYSLSNEKRGVVSSLLKDYGIFHLLRHKKSKLPSLQKNIAFLCHILRWVSIHYQSLKYPPLHCCFIFPSAEWKCGLFPFLKFYADVGVPQKGQGKINFTKLFHFINIQLEITLLESTRYFSIRY